MEPQQNFSPKGKARTPFDHDSTGRFSSELMNLAYLKDQAAGRNKYYLALIIVCVLCVVYVSLTANYRTYVVRVDNATGRVEAVGELKATNYQPRDAEIRHFLVQYVTQIRTIPLDPVLFKSNWNTAQHFMTKEAAQKLNTMIAKENPVSKLGKFTIQPQLKSIQLQPGSSRTFQVRWTEEEYSISGGTTGKKENYVALFTILIQPPTKEDELLINPLGIKIADLSYAREQDATKE